MFSIWDNLARNPKFLTDNWHDFPRSLAKVEYSFATQLCPCLEAKVNRIYIVGQEPQNHRQNASFHRTEQNVFCYLGNLWLKLMKLYLRDLQTNLCAPVYLLCYIMLYIFYHFMIIFIFYLCIYCVCRLHVLSAAVHGFW